jgi:hypothetical protein
MPCANIDDKLLRGAELYVTCNLPVVCIEDVEGGMGPETGKSFRQALVGSDESG